MGFEIPVSRLAALAADEIISEVKRPTWDTLSPNMIASIIDRFTGLPQLLDALQFIANQECENKGEYASCLDTGICVTEFCLPCYARASLLKHRSLSALYPGNQIDGLLTKTIRLKQEVARLTGRAENRPLTTEEKAWAEKAWQKYKASPPKDTIICMKCGFEVSRPVEGRATSNCQTCGAAYAREAFL